MQGHWLRGQKNHAENDKYAANANGKCRKYCDWLCSEKNTGGNTQICNSIKQKNTRGSKIPGPIISLPVKKIEIKTNCKNISHPD